LRRRVNQKERQVTVREVIGRLPSAPGVYRFRDATGRVLYIGRAVDPRRRVASYLGGLKVRLPSQLAMTPAAWQPFAQRNAELAARLLT